MRGARHSGFQLSVQPSAFWKEPGSVTIWSVAVFHTRCVARECSLLAAGHPVRVASHCHVVTAGDCHQHVVGGSGSPGLGSVHIAFLV